MQCVHGDLPVFNSSCAHKHITAASGLLCGRSTVEACQQLGTLVANLPLNLPEQLQSMQMAGATGQGAVSRRDLMKLCGHASTKQVELLGQLT